MAPNILFLFSDQQRWDTVSCYGNPIVENLTPHLDRLAADGVRFQNAFTCQPVCGPARSCLQTGLYATENNCPTNGWPLPRDAHTVADQLHGAGYETAYIGKWHLASDRHGGQEENFQTRAVPPDRRGGFRDHWLAADILEFTSHGYEGYMFDTDCRRVDFEGYRVDCCTNFIVDYLRDYATRAPHRPFYCFASYIEPHHQNDIGRFVGPIGSKQRFAEYNCPGDLEGTGGDWRTQLPDYLGCCWALDRAVGRLRQELELLGLAEDTLIVYTSDHGSHFCTRNGEYKRACHDGCLRIPMIVAGPGFSGGQVVDELVSLIDLPPTVVQAAEAEPMAMQGRPLQEAVGGAGDWPDHVFAQISESHCGRCVRTDRWKYSVRAPDHVEHHKYSDVYVEDFLYDLEADPEERNNLVGSAEHADIRAGFAELVKQRVAEIENLEIAIRPAE